MRKAIAVRQRTARESPASADGQEPTRGRPRINAKVEDQIRQRLQQGAGVAQIRRETGAGFSAITRIKSVLDTEQEAERRALLVRIAGYVVKGSNLSKREISDLIFKATGVRLNPGAMRDH